MRTLETRLWVHRSNTVTANARGHWSKTAPGIAVNRQMGAIESRNLPRLAGAVFTAEVSYPDKIGRDVVNLYPVMKAYIDGLVNPDGKRTKPERGLLPDDNDRYASGPHMEWSAELSGRPEFFLFVVTIAEREPRIPAWER